MLLHRNRLRPLRHQKGQAIVFIILFLPVLVLSLLFLYHAGRVTSEKMQLDNAADAAAYSIATLEARDLNFMAYTNRAMIANEVAIGQLVGLASWAQHWKSYYAYLKAYDTLVLNKVTFGISTAIIDSAFRVVFDVAGTAAYDFLAPLANTGASGLSAINSFYGLGQTGFHYTTLFYDLLTIQKVIDSNAPGAELSPFGLISLLGHMETFGLNPSKPGGFIRTYKPNSDKSNDTGGMQRFAALVRQSRDEFTGMRGWNWLLKILDIDKNICVPSCGGLYAQLHIKIYLAFNLRRMGGSELRYVGKKARGDKFNWSAADDTDVDINFAFDASAKVCAKILGKKVCVSFGGLGLDVGDNSVSLVLHLPSPLNLIKSSITLIPKLPFPTSIPFSGGGYQNGKAQLTASTLKKDLNTWRYGGAGRNLIAWTVPLLGTKPVIQQIPANKGTGYRGLPMYSDTDPSANQWSFQAPYILIGLTKSFDKITAGDPKTTGQFDMSYGSSKGGDPTKSVAVISKGEVYFSRPNDLSYFKRGDGYTEYGSAFNPYWQARLAPVTQADQVVALSLQQNQQFGQATTTLNLPTWNYLNLIP